MKIDAVQVHTLDVDGTNRWVVLELRTDSGLRGFGESLLPRSEGILTVAVSSAARPLIGTSLPRARPPAKRLADERATGLLEATVQAAIDQALWDLRARVFDAPLFELLGPTRRQPIQLYANINRGTRDRRAEGFGERAAAAAEEGFAAIKIAPFDGVTRANAHTRDGRAAFARAIDRVGAVRDAIGWSRRLMIDCHCRLDLATSLEFLDATSGLRIDWFEDVLPYHDIDSWRHLRAASRAPLAGGESGRGIKDLLPFLNEGIWDVVMPDIRYFGVTELVALAPLAQQFQVQIAPHNPAGPVGTLASAHAMASCPVFDHLEYQWRDCAWRDELTQDSESISDGALHLGHQPGIGLAWDDAVAKRVAVPAGG